MPKSWKNKQYWVYCGAYNTLEIRAPFKTNWICLRHLSDIYIWPIWHFPDLNIKVGKLWDGDKFFFGVMFIPTRGGVAKFSENVFFRKPSEKISWTAGVFPPLPQIILGHDTVASRCRLYITLYILSHDGPSTTFPSMTVAPPTPTDD